MCHLGVNIGALTVKVVAACAGAIVAADKRVQAKATTSRLRRPYTADIELSNTTDYATKPAVMTANVTQLS